MLFIRYSSDRFTEVYRGADLIQCFAGGLGLLVADFFFLSSILFYISTVNDRWLFSFFSPEQNLPEILISLLIFQHERQHIPEVYCF